MKKRRCHLFLLVVLILILCVLMPSIHWSSLLHAESQGEKVNVDKAELYRSYLAQILDDLSNGIVMGEEMANPELKENIDFLYSILDVNCDNMDELLLITRVNNIEKILYVITCDSTGEPDLIQATTLLEVTPNTVFYDNGIVKTDWSHNQGRITGNVWPYDLYNFDPNTGEYQYFASATSWKQKTTDKDFLSHIDQDEDGEIFCIAQERSFGPGMNINTAGHWCDGAEYLEWITSIIDNAKIVNVEFQKLTYESIA